MANLRIQEFAGLGQDPNGSVQAVAGPTIAEQVIAIGTVANSVAFNKNTTVICVEAEAICAIALGNNSVAAVASATTSKRLVAGQTEYFRVSAAAGDFISVISST
jgi:hypothetical protein